MDTTGRKVTITVPPTWSDGDISTWSFPAWELGPEPTPDQYAEIISIDLGQST